MIDPTEIVDDLTGVAKKAMDNQQTERLKIDSTSPFKLPQLITPIIGFGGQLYSYTAALLFVAVLALK